MLSVYRKYPGEFKTQSKGTGLHILHGIILVFVEKKVCSIPGY